VTAVQRPVITSRVVARPRAAIIAALVPDKFHHVITPGFSNGGRYSRIQEAIELLGDGPSNPGQIGTTATIRVFTELELKPDGTTGPIAFGADFTGTVTFNGEPVGSVDVKAADSRFDVPVALPPLAEGWYLVSASGLPLGWGVLDYWMYVRKGPKAIPQATMPVLTESHEHTFNGFVLSSALVPAVYKPTPMLVPPRDTPPFSGVPTADQIAYTMLSPFREGAMRRPSFLRSGVMTTFNIEAYYYASMQAKLPQWHLLDGPCGIGTITCPTSIRETGRPNSAKCTGTDPWRVWTRGHDGTIRTVAGYVHDEPLPYVNLESGSQDYPGVPPRLVGDWSAIPADRRGFHELWDIAWDPDTLLIDHAQPLVNGEPPHVGIGPKAYVTDTQNGRVCMIQCNGGGPAGVALFGTNDRNAPAKVTEFLVGLSKPWGCEVVGATLHVTEQGGGKVTAYDKTTAAVQWSVPLPGAEGCRYQDGILYVGSAASRTLWKLDVATKTFTPHATVPVGYYINVAVSDGSFFPRGYTATVTWLDQQFGFPMIWDTNGKEVSRYTLGFIPPSQGGKPMKGMPFPHAISYPTAVSLGDGRMTWGAVQEGLHRISAALASDTFVDPLVLKGAQEWKDKHYDLLFEPHGFGFYGLPLPWGESTAIDAYLKQYGHALVTTPPPDTTPPPVQPPPATPPPITPPTGSSMQFKSVALRDISDLVAPQTPTDRYSPPATPHVRWEIEFGGSGGAGGVLGAAAGFGDKIVAICRDAVSGFTHLDNIDVPFRFNVYNSGSLAAPVLRIFPIDALPLQVPYPKRTRTELETWHDGYAYNTTPDFNSGGRATGGVYEPFTARKYDAMMAVLATRYPQVNWAKKGTTLGHSMGGTAGFQWALYRYKWIGGFYACVPRVRMPNVIGGSAPNAVPDYNFGADTVNPGLIDASQNKPYVETHDHVKWLLDNPTTKTPYQIVVAASNDGFGDMRDYFDWLAACRATKRPHAMVIMNAYHAGSYGDSVINTRMRASYTPDLFDGRAQVVFLNSSRDDDDLLKVQAWPLPPTGAEPIPYSQSVNVGFKWQIVQDDAQKFVVKVYSALNDPASGVFITKEGYPIGASSVNVSMPDGLGNILVGDQFRFQGDATVYTSQTTILDVSKGGVLQFTPALTKALPQSIGGSRIAIQMATPVSRAALAPVSVDVLPYSDVFTAAVASQRVTIPPQQWVTVTFDATVAQPPPVVIPPAQVLTFTADKTTITRGESIALAFTTKDTVRVLINSGPNGAVEQMADVNGSIIVTPLASMKYRLDADGADANSVVAFLDVTVNDPPVVVGDPQLVARVSANETEIAALKAKLQAVQDFLVDTFDHYDPQQ
jgi:hypothetical protein